MDLFGTRQKQLLHFLTADAEKETLDYVLQEMREVLGEEMPEEDAVRAYLQDPDKPTKLSTEQQIVVMDKLLECAEVNLRTLCDLIRYQQLKDAGVKGRRQDRRSAQSHLPAVRAVPSVSQVVGIGVKSRKKK